MGRPAENADGRRAHLSDRALYRAFYEHDLTPGVVGTLCWDEPRVAWALAHLGERDDVLEIGCHKGELTRYLSYKSQGRCVALDLSVRSIRQAAMVYEGIPIGFLVGDAAALPIASRAFDVVVLAEILEHVPDPALVLDEAERVARDGGRVVISVPKHAIAMEQEGRERAEAMGAMPLDAHVREFDPSRELAGRPELQVATGTIEGMTWHLASYRVWKGMDDGGIRA